jgi:hypothetical protein
MATFEISAHVTVRSGQLESVKKPAAECIRCKVREAYSKFFKDYADHHFMTFYGEPNAQLLDLVKAHFHHQQRVSTEGS